MTVHEQIATPRTPLDDVFDLLECRSPVSAERHRDVVECDDLVVGVREVGNFATAWPDGEHAGELMTDEARFVEVAHGGKQVATY